MQIETMFTYVQLPFIIDIVIYKLIPNPKEPLYKTCNETEEQYIKRREATLCTHLGEHAVVPSDSLGMMQCKQIKRQKRKSN